MERERPKYLPPIETKRWEFPWIAKIGVSLLSAVIGGAVIYKDTVEAWVVSRKTTSTEKHVATKRADTEEERNRLIATIRAQREDAEMRLKQAEQRQREGWKCVGETVFRPITGGGWENVPGAKCW